MAVTHEDCTNCTNAITGVQLHCLRSIWYRQMCTSLAQSAVVKYRSFRLIIVGTFSTGRQVCIAPTRAGAITASGDRLIIYLSNKIVRIFRSNSVNFASWRNGIRVRRPDFLSVFNFRTLYLSYRRSSVCVAVTSLSHLLVSSRATRRNFFNIQFKIRHHGR